MSRQRRRRITKREKQEAELLLGLVISPAVTMAAATTPRTEWPGKKELADVLAHTTLPTVLEALLPAQLSRGDVYEIAVAAIRHADTPACTKEIELLKKEIEVVNGEYKDIKDGMKRARQENEQTSKEERQMNERIMEELKILKKTLETDLEPLAKRVTTAETQNRLLQARISVLDQRITALEK